MEQIIGLIIVFGLPLSLALFVRANAGAMFLASSAGIVLLGTLNTNQVDKMLLNGDNRSFLPAVVLMGLILYSALIFRKTIRGWRSIFNLAVAFLLSLMLMLQLPLLTGFTALFRFQNYFWWQRAALYDFLIIAIGLIFSLLLLLLGGRRSANFKKHH